MTGYNGGLTGTDNVRKSGDTQPRPTGDAGRNPGQGTGAVVQGFVGPAGEPVIVKTGANNNGGGSKGSRGGQR